MFALRGRDAAATWSAAAGPSDPALARRTDPCSLRALHGGAGRADNLLSFARSAAAGAREVAFWFGGRVPAGAAAAPRASDAMYAIVPCRVERAPVVFSAACGGAAVAEGIAALEHGAGATICDLWRHSGLAAALGDTCGSTAVSGGSGAATCVAIAGEAALDRAWHVAHAIRGAIGEPAPGTGLPLLWVAPHMAAAAAVLSAAAASASDTTGASHAHGWPPAGALEGSESADAVHTVVVALGTVRAPAVSEVWRLAYARRRCAVRRAGVAWTREWLRRRRVAPAGGCVPGAARLPRRARGNGGAR